MNNRAYPITVEGYRKIYCCKEKSTNTVIKFRVKAHVTEACHPSICHFLQFRNHQTTEAPIKMDVSFSVRVNPICPKFMITC